MSDNSNLANSIWPNGMKVDSDGYAVFYPLGTNKINVPTDSAEWPEGDKLVSPFVYQDDKLVGFCDTKAMTVNGQTSITLNYKHIEADFSSIEEGMLTITAPNATVVKYTWSNSTSSDTGNSGDTVVLGTKYLGCKTVDEVKSVDPDYLTNDIVDGSWTQSLVNLTDGNLEQSYNTGMFYQCGALTTFTSDLSSLIDGYYMFSNCSSLTSFDADLSSLTEAEYMFVSCDKLETFTSDLSSLENGKAMFYNCSALETFIGDLSSFTGHQSGQMFQNCFNLKSFTSNLSSLEEGFRMFSDCKLDTASLKNIAETIATHGSSGQIHIGIGNTEPNEEEHTYLTQIYNKRWDIYVNGSNYTPNSPASLTTLDETGETIETPIPFYAKPVPATEETAEYVDENGNYYNILGAQFIYVSDPETYGMFTCLEDAAANMRLTKLSK